MKQNLRFLMLTLLCAVFSVAWGQTTYKLEEVTSVEAGGLYVFEQDDHVMNNTVSNNALQTTTTYKTTNLKGNESYVWTLEAATNGFYFKNVSLKQYLNNTSGSTNVSFGDKDNGSIWAFNFQNDNTLLIQNISNSNRYLGFTNATSYAYKAYSTNSLTYSHEIKVYKLVEDLNPVTTPSISVNSTSVDISSAEDEGTIEVSYVNVKQDAELLDIIFYEENGVTQIQSDPTWISIEIDNNFNIYFLTDANTGNSPRSVYFKVYGIGDNEEYVYSDLITITQAGYTAPLDILLYEGFSNYSGNDGTTSITNTNEHLDYKNWNTITRVYPGTSSGSTNGGCLRFGSSSGNGTMATNSIPLSGSAQLTYCLKKYGSDNGKISVTVNGATASGDVSVSASNSWELFTVNLEDATDNVTITFASTNRVYVDEIQLVKVNTNKVALPTFSPGEGTYIEAQSVRITTTTDGATIYYTTDETEPTVDPNKAYTGSVSITTRTVLKAIAVKDGMNPSNVASATYIIQPNAPTITVSEANEVTITAASGLNIYYTIDNTAPTNASSQYTTPFTPERSCTVKAIAYDTYGNASEIVEHVVNLPITPRPKNISSNYFVKVNSADDLEDGDAILIVSENDQKAMSTTQNNNNRGTEGVSITDGIIDSPSQEVQKIILVGATNAWYFYVENENVSGYLYAAGTNSNILQTEDEPDDNAKATISINSEGDATIVFQGANTRNNLRYNPNTNTSNPPIFACYASSNTTMAKPQIYKEVPVEAVSINSLVGYASLYYGTENLKLPSGVTATTYTLTADNKPTISKTYNPGDVIPADEGVILQGTGGNYKFEVISSTTATKDANNKLKGSDTAETTTGPGGDEETEYKFYVLSAESDGSKPGFYWYAENGGEFESAAHKVYLPIPIGSGDASSFTFDDMNGIRETMISNTQTGDVYTISGVKVTGNQLQKGLYIINGKKVVIK